MCGSCVCDSCCTANRPKVVTWRVAGMHCEHRAVSRGDAPFTLLQSCEHMGPSNSWKKPHGRSFLCIYFCRATSCCLKEHYRSGYFYTSLFICLPHTWAGCVLGVEYSLAFPNVARKKQVFQVLSPLPMLPYATFPTVGHQCWHTGPGLGTREALRGSSAPQCLRAVCGAVRRAGHTSVNFEGTHMAPPQHLCVAQCRHPGCLAGSGDRHSVSMGMFTGFASWVASVLLLNGFHMQRLRSCL